MHPISEARRRGFPSDSIDTLRAGLNFTLVTDLGWLGLLGEVAGGGTYEDLLPEPAELELSGAPCRVLHLDSLIRVKRAAGRPRTTKPSPSSSCCATGRPRASRGRAPGLRIS